MVDAINAAARKVPAWLLYVLAALPPAWLLYLAATGGLGVEPVNALERELGLLSLQLLLVGLAITPLQRLAGIRLLKFRRAIGVVSFVYVLLHLLVWAALDVQILSQVWADILKRPYITVGMAGFVLLIPLAVTSNDRSVRALGPRWRSLHRLVYAAVLLGAAHFVMVQKVWEVEALAYLGAAAGLIAVRYLPKRRTRRDARPA